jgi:hypothetical protein
VDLHEITEFGGWVQVITGGWRWCRPVRPSRAAGTCDRRSDDRRHSDERRPDRTADLSDPLDPATGSRRAADDRGRIGAHERAGSAADGGVAARHPAGIVGRSTADPAAVEPFE